MKVVCIDDKNKPLDIPNHKWIKEKQTYTISKVVRMKLQNNELGVELEEIDLTDCFPYNYFSLKRFAPIEPENLLERERIKTLEIEEELK